VFAGNEVPLDKHLLLDGGEIAELLRKGILHGRQRFDGGAHHFKSGGALITGCPAGERVTAKISREADPGSEDGTMLLLTAGHPIGRVFDECGESHHGGEIG
jgi:hypothetical protein